MQLHEAHELTEVYTTSDATRLIQTEGWTLLDTVGTDARVVYVLGKKKPQKPLPPISPGVIGVGSSRRLTR